MSAITLSTGVRANLLSLQSTTDLMASTQNKLATGKKVNSALDNPVNFFTASGLDSRANDITALLDTIGNGVQALQAANTGITSLTNLVSTAKSIAQQALQAPIGYSTKSNVSTTIAGATASDLRGTTTYTSATANSNALSTGSNAVAASTTTLDGTKGVVTGSVVNNNNTTTTAITAATKLFSCRPASARTVCKTLLARPKSQMERRSPSTATRSPSRSAQTRRLLLPRSAPASLPLPVAISRQIPAATRSFISVPLWRTRRPQPSATC